MWLPIPLVAIFFYSYNPIRLKTINYFIYSRNSAIFALSKDKNNIVQHSKVIQLWMKEKILLKH